MLRDKKYIESLKKYLIIMIDLNLIFFFKHEQITFVKFITLL